MPEIGNKISFVSKAIVDYNEDSQRVLFRDEIPGEGIICGMVQKCLGTYQGRRRSFSPFEGDDPPWLKVSQRIWLYEVRTSLKSKPFLVSPEDVI